MIIPKEFVESFDNQYPNATLDYELPKSLDKFPTIKTIIERAILDDKRLSLPYLHQNIVYDILQMSYYYPETPDKTYELTQTGYAIITKAIYAGLQTNKSEKTFEYVLDDIKEINPDLFYANLIAQVGNYYTIRSIDLISSWLKYCNAHGKFKMDYEDYNSFVNKDTTTEQMVIVNNDIVADITIETVPDEDIPQGFADDEDND